MKLNLLHLQSLVAGSIGVLCVFFCTNCQSTTYQSITEAHQTSNVASDVLGTGDVVSVVFPGAIQFNQTQKIRLDGKISLPIIGEVMAVGKTPADFRDELTQQYESELQDPEVIVSLVHSAAVVYVNGQVAMPGKVVLDRRMTVFDAIMEAGGFATLANKKKVILTRQENGKRKRYQLNFKDEEAQVFYVQPYDTITVGERLL